METSGQISLSNITFHASLIPSKRRGCVAAGHIYRPDAGQIVCAYPLAVCTGSPANKAAVILRCIAIGLASTWHSIVVFQGMKDMARMPLGAFR